MHKNHVLFEYIYLKIQNNNPKYYKLHYIWNEVWFIYKTCFKLLYFFNQYTYVVVKVHYIRV